MGVARDFYTFTVPKFGHEARELFFLEEGFTSLNHGSFGALPKPVQDGCLEITKEIEHNPDGFLRKKLLDRIDQVRELVAPILGVDVETCVFVPNISTAVTTVLNNFEWTENDSIVYTDSVFDSVLLSINRLETPKKSVFKLPYPLSHKSIVEEFQNHIKSQVSLTAANGGRVVAIFETIMPSPGIVLPWKEMVRVCRQEGAWSVVDGAHSIGHEENLDVAAADPDFWMTNCSKWLFTKRGCSVLYVPLRCCVPKINVIMFLNPKSRNQGLIKSTLTPSLAYPTPGKSPSPFVSKFYWNGSADPMSVLSLEYALAFRKYIGGDKKINHYCHSLALRGGRLVAEMLHTEVMDSDLNPGELIGNMVNVRLPLRQDIKPSGEIHLSYQNTMLDTHRVFAPIFYYRERWWVRMSAQIYNDISDYRKLGEAIKEFCTQLEAKTSLSSAVDGQM